MNSNEPRAHSGFEQTEKISLQERKRKAAYLESIFENAETIKKAAKADNVIPGTKGQLQQQQQQQQLVSGTSHGASKISINGSGVVNSSVTGRVVYERSNNCDSSNTTSSNQRSVDLQSLPTAAVGSSCKKSRANMSSCTQQVNSSITNRVAYECNNSCSNTTSSELQSSPTAAVGSSSKKNRVNMSLHITQQQAVAAGGSNSNIVVGSKLQREAGVVANHCSGGIISHNYTTTEQKRHSPENSSSSNISRDVQGQNDSGSTESRAVVVKQEKVDSSTDSAMNVQIVSVQGSQEQTTVVSTSNDAREPTEIGDAYIKFLLFAGRLYRCAKVTNLTHNALHFDPENIQNRKGKVVVLLLFHRTYREIMCYVVGVVEHATSKDETVTIKVIKAQNYPCSLARSPNKDTSLAEGDELKFEIGAKKMLHNMYSLDGPVYGELVKILDGFGANSAVDHVKITEFNALVNANADRFDGQLPNSPPTSMSLPLVRSVNYGSAQFARFGHRLTNMGNPRVGYSGSPPANNRQSREAAYSPPHSQAGPPLERATSRVVSRSDHDLRVGYCHASHAGRLSKSDQALYAAAHAGVRVSPGNYNGHVTNSEHSTRNGTALPSSAHYRSAMREEKIAQERSISSGRSAQDLQTVAELCKEKMKRDMAEQELKSIRAAFEEFKSQMQHHLSQVEERMVLLEAENRSLKGKLTNMHQSNGYAEKKYHELRARLEELLKTI